MGGQAAEDYYTQEHQISVAKYSPYQAIKLYNRINLVTTGGGTTYFSLAGDVEASITPFIGATVVSAEQTPSITGLDHIKVTGVQYVSAFNETRVDVSPSFSAALIANTYVSLIMSTMTNKTGDDTWPGDPDYLEDKFVRFSYRFKYDDNEYSLMAPFTQIAYIPKQDGYFLNGDEDAAYQSTVVSFMENQVQNIGLVIPLPTSASRLSNDYKIKEVEILFRESDAVAVKVLESISVGEVAGSSGINNYYTYDYQSRKPYKTLPEAQTVRVYDKVPVRAFSQESSGNRIIYGNYRDQHTPPANINYNCRISKKSSTGKYNNWIEYPNHSVKRNRNYQVGFVLADKFGRQSPVLLSSVDQGITSDGQFYFGSTIYSPYDISFPDTNVKNWFGDAIMVLVNSEISSTKNLALGTPGLYAIKQDAGSGNGEGYAVALTGNTIINTTYNFRLNVTPPNNNNNNIPRVGDYLRGAYQDFVKVLTVTETNPAQNQWQATTDGQVSDVYLRQDDLPAGQPDLKFAYTINDLGWYSYKIVVKQTQQEYYNVYLPGILNGYPGQSGAINTPLFVDEDTPGGIDNGIFPDDETNKTAFTVLFNDNINKIPRDLAEVGPDQKQYRSSVTLFGRVTNIMTVGTYDAGTGISDSTPFNSQYYARVNSEGKTAISHTSTAIARAKEVNMGYADLSTDNDQMYDPLKAFNTGAVNGNKVFYQIDTNPLICRISTVDKSIGATALNFVLAQQTSGSTTYDADNLNNPLDTSNMLPYLAVYETEPAESLLDIYWETTSEGLIVDLNADVLSGAGGATSFINLTWDFTEQTIQNTFVTGYFEPVNSSGQVFATPTTAELIATTNGDGEPVTGLFDLRPGSGSFAGQFRLRYIGATPLVFIDSSRTTDVYSFSIKITTADGDVSIIPIPGEVSGFGALKNLTPTVDNPPLIPAISTTKETRVIIPGYSSAGSPWPAANPQNGTGATNNTLQLQYTIQNPNDLPDNWEMNSATGELTQAIPGDIIDGVTFGGNISALYNITIRVTDANGDTDLPSNDPYGTLYIEFSVPITVGYAAVNEDVLSNTCIVNPNPSTVNSELIFTTDPNTGLPVGPVTGIWYMAQGISPSDSYLGIYDLANNQPNYPFTGITLAEYNVKRRILRGAPTSEGGSHRSGTIALTANFKQENPPSGAPPGTESNFGVEKIEYYYRTRTGDTLQEWREIRRDLEYNQSGVGDSIESPKWNEPEYQDAIPIPTLWQTKNGNIGGPDQYKWVQTIRSFDFLKLSEGNNIDSIEYVFIIRNLQQTAGSTSLYPAVGWCNCDDLHYPGCIPWQGTNIADGAYWATNNEYQYFRSAPGGDNPNDTQPVNTNILYAETPYVEYVNQFFTDPQMQIPYVPSGGAYVSVQLNRNYQATQIIPDLTDWVGEPLGEVTFSVGLDAEGVRSQNENTGLGVNTAPTFLNATSLPINVNAGLTRIKTPL